MLMHLFDMQFRSVEHQIPLIAVGLRETKDLEFKPNFKVSAITAIHCNCKVYSNTSLINLES